MERPQHFKTTSSDKLQLENFRAHDRFPPRVFRPFQSPLAPLFQRQLEPIRIRYVCTDYHWIYYAGNGQTLVIGLWESFDLCYYSQVDQNSKREQNDNNTDWHFYDFYAFYHECGSSFALDYLHLHYYGNVTIWISQVIR